MALVQVAAELGVAPELVRLIVSGNEFRNDAALLCDQNVQAPFQLQVRTGLLGVVKPIPTLTSLSSSTLRNDAALVCDQNVHAPFQLQVATSKAWSCDWQVKMLDISISDISGTASRSEAATVQPECAPALRAAGMAGTSCCRQSSQLLLSSLVQSR